MRKSIYLLVGLLLIVFAAAGLAAPALAEGGGITVYLPLIAKPLPIQVPPGFHIRIYADNLAGRPRFMAIGPDGHFTSA